MDQIQSAKKSKRSKHAFIAMIDGVLPRKSGEPAKLSLHIGDTPLNMNLNRYTTFCKRLWSEWLGRL